MYAVGVAAAMFVGGAFLAAAMRATFRRGDGHVCEGHLPGCFRGHSI